MKKLDILARINDMVYEGLYSFEDVEQDLDDSIDEINEALNSKFPYFSEVLTDETKEYKYAPDLELPEELVEIFPWKYIRSVCINYAVAELMRKEDEFGMLYQTANQKYLKGIDVMFRDYFKKVPEIFQDTEGGYLELEGENPESDVIPDHHWGFDD